jgi:hypothetical protein
LFCLSAGKTGTLPVIDLRKAAEREGVDVKGTLWVIEAMITHQVITVQAARVAYKKMKDKGRRLPWEVAEARLCEMERHL